MGDTYRGIAVVSVWILATLIAASGAVAGLRALTGGLAGTGAVIDELAVDQSGVPRPPATQEPLQVVIPPSTATTTTTFAALGPFPSTTLIIPELRRSPSAPAPAPPPPPAVVVGTSAPPPTTTTSPPAPPTTLPATVVHSYELTGGWVQVVHTGVTISLDASAANEGFSTTVHSSGPSTVSIRFDSANHSSLLAVRLVRGEVVASVTENPAG